MIINYERGNVSLMVDIDKIDFINIQEERYDERKGFMYSIEIGLNTGRTIDIRCGHKDRIELHKVLQKYMQTRSDYMTAVNPFLNEEIIGKVSTNALNACKRLGIVTLGDLVKHSRQDFLALEQVGKKTVTELDELLEDHLLHWGYKA
jgi:hypothetical protein